MTTEAPQHAPNPLLYLVGGWLFYLAVFTPTIALGWNLGLNGAGIVDHTIDWMTAAGLSFLVMLARFVVGAARSTSLVVGR